MGFYIDNYWKFRFLFIASVPRILGYDNSFAGLIYRQLVANVRRTEVHLWYVSEGALPRILGNDHICSLAHVPTMRDEERH